MKLCRMRKDKRVIPAALDGEDFRELSAHINDFDPVFFANDGSAGLRDIDLSTCPIVEGHDGFDPPVVSPSKLVCVGLNYYEHAKEAGLPIPTEPVLFLKAPTAICGANDPILYPADATKLDWEVELAFVMSKRARLISKADALDYVGGYMILNDVSERSYQFDRGGQWMKGKSYDSFAPIGPFLVTPESVGDPHALDLRLELNDEVMQQGNSADFIFDLPTVIENISRHMTLLPGDVVTTGTPPGVGLGMRPQRFMSPGDVVSASITGLGQQRQSVIPDRVSS